LPLSFAGKSNVSFFRRVNREWGSSSPETGTAVSSRRIPADGAAEAPPGENTPK
jgi:hypothetical protein